MRNQGLAVNLVLEEGEDVTVERETCSVATIESCSVS